ncbi:hypothetical protein PPO43_09520 [Saprospira sp. CCB-QB6]|uniref:hypothetical protein n=1 Tax=Saprospira sp. CCB-QB6 TaxID=3023936 RepID=UPI00234ADD56|nr:hypothetical protein [Saprospira sp. CCB-QB6]WCL80214.1 hypothetical protein PPO43_09520 [Saprospira sp. CCB-QB6]
MKHIITLLCCCFFALQVSWAQSSKTLVQTLPLAAATASLEIAAEVEIEYWEEAQVRITTEVIAENVSEAILKKLVMIGRYNIVQKETPKGLVLYMPKMEHQVILRGQILDEQLKIKVQLPKGMKLQTVDKSAL